MQNPPRDPLSFDKTGTTVSKRLGVPLEGDNLTLALATQPVHLAGRCEVCNATLVVCKRCNAKWCLDHRSAPLVCPCCGSRPGGRDTYLT